MGIGNSLQELGRFLDECDRDGRVNSIELAASPSSGHSGTLTAELELVLPTCSPDGTDDGISLRGASIDADGKLRFGFETSKPVVPTTDHDIELDPRSVDLDTDGTVSVTLSAFVPAGGDSKAIDTDSEDRDRDPDEHPAGTASTTDEADGRRATRRDPDVPPFEDPEFLAEVYESCETFAEMAEALEMDVTAETVRRYMIDHGIHEPRSYDTSGDDVESTELDDDLQTPVVLADGIGLPDDVTVDTIVETVRKSKTIYEVKDDIGIEREDALEMLRELNLLELVVGRLATEAEREVRREVIVERLRENADPQVGTRQ